jgi:hypothetical protein
MGLFHLLIQAFFNHSNSILQKLFSNNLFMQTGSCYNGEVAQREMQLDYVIRV